MSAKLLQALTDDNRDLQKQIGCMTGIFQLFDRNHIVTRRRIKGHNHKRLPPGHSHIKINNLGVEPNNEKNLNENQRVSSESPRGSLSSSSGSSTFSSLDCSKPAQPESPSYDRSFSPETPLMDPFVSQPNASPQLGRRSLDFRDVVKDSIYREIHGLPVKTITKEEAVSHAMKHKDSPRPFQLSKSINKSHGSGTNGKPRVPVDLNESLKVLAKLRDVPSYFNEAKEPPRSSNEFSVPKDAPRFSYDGRDIPRPSFEPRENKSTIKLRELPRLSLDSREGSVRGSNSDSKSKSNSILKDLKRGIGNSVKISNPNEVPGTYKQSPTVVAKLMGLEAFPNSISVIESQTEFIKTCPNDGHNVLSRSSKTTDETKQNQISGSPRSTLKDSVSPRLKNSDSVMKPISSSRFPIEPAPWRQQNGARGFQKQVLRNQETTARAPHSYPSVYSEIEKRLKELEFKQSDKDLRALKQILEAMQSKGLFETKKENQTSISVPQIKYNSPNHPNLDQHPRLANRRNPYNNCQTSVTIKGTSAPRTFESPIVIIKPAKLIGNSRIPAPSAIPIDGLLGLHKPQNGDTEDKKMGYVNSHAAMNHTPKQSLRDTANRTLNSADEKNHGRTLSSAQTSARPQPLSTRENTGSSGRSSGSVSPRLQQKKLEFEKRSRPPNPSSDLSKPRRQSIKHPAESGTPGRKLRTKSHNLQQSGDRLSKNSSETRNSSQQGDEISLQSDSSISLASHIDTEVTSPDHSTEMNFDFFQQDSQRPFRKIVNSSASSLKQKKPSLRLNEDRLVAELASAASEQPSPVSVLNTSFYRDDLPSPVKKISNVFKDDETQCTVHNPDEDGWNLVDLDHRSDNTGPHVSSDISRKKLESVEHLVQKLRRLNSNHDEATTDYIASLCDNTNPDHRYISEMLLASGLLLRGLSSGLTTIQFHPSGHPINPDLFFVLEQTKVRIDVTKDKDCIQKAVQSKFNQEKFHRKLVFDTVNEILLRKLVLLEPSPEPRLRAGKLSRRNLSAQQLLRELCLEIDQLHDNNSDCNFDADDDGLKSILRKDVVHRSENWSDFHGEVPGIVLDIERLIFKDLVDEIINGESASLRARPRWRKQLFAG